MTRLQNVLLVAACVSSPPAIAAAVLGVGAPVPSTLDVTGVLGNIGEWDVTATLTREGNTREFSGSMMVTHTGWCSKDGPLEKTGKLTVKLSWLSSSISARIHLDDEACAYAGTLSDAYVGEMACPGRRPVQLLLWMR